MAAATFPTTKGLSLIFTLLCLVCFASPLTDKDMLEEFKEKLQKAQEETDSVKAKYKSEIAGSSEQWSKYMDLMEQMIALTTDNMSDSSFDFPPLDMFLKKARLFMQKTKDYIDSKEEELAVKLEDTEEKLRKMNRFIQFLEENQTEL